jgi:chromosome segregation ATPase
MPIELLYIIPIIAVVFLIFIVSFVSQKKSANLEREKNLASEVRQFNDGKMIAQQTTPVTETRLNEFERTITSINKALSDQQQVIERFQQDNTGYTSEIDKLKRKLRELHKEYDIVVSENYSLRAKVNTFSKPGDNIGSIAVRFNELESLINTLPAHDHSIAAASKQINPLDDTKVTAALNLDDTHEVKISDLIK